MWGFINIQKRQGISELWQRNLRLFERNIKRSVLSWENEVTDKDYWVESVCQMKKFVIAILVNDLSDIFL